MQKWDYAVQNISLRPQVPPGLDMLTTDESVILLYVLDQWGEKGWELATILPVDSINVRAVFKRPQEPAETSDEQKERVQQERFERRAKGRISS
jgi:hypothetical protein